VLVTLLAPAGLYGYFPVITDDELFIVLDPSDYSTEKAALRFPRMRDKGGRSFADFLRPEGDLLAVQMVTIGGDIDEWVSKRSRGGDSGVPGTVAEYLVDGLEARVTLEITRGLGLPPGTGGSVGFGLPGFPLLQEQQSMYELMAVEERLGVVLSETFQPVPRYSRLGLYVCHSGAKNF
jgi:5-methyltetrahydrofolate--homocysteine methyltransferase